MLPSIPQPTETVRVGDTDVTVRGLSVTEVRKVHDAAGADEGDAMAIAFGTGCSVEEASAWLDSAPALAAQEVMAAILRLTGLLDGQKSGD